MSQKKSIILDPISPRDWAQYHLIYCCEQCSHYDPSSDSCTFGFLVEPHKEKNQKYLYELKGKMAFCRFLEID